MACTKNKKNIFVKYTSVLVTLLITVFILTGCTNSIRTELKSIVDPVTKIVRTDKINTDLKAEKSDNLLPSKAVQQFDTSVPIEIFSLDIGQGDAHLLRIHNEFYLIDTGDVAHRDFIVARLKHYGISTFKGIIITHADSDHLGGFWAIAQHFKIEAVYDNGFDKNSSVYKTYLKTLERKNVTRNILRKGDELDLGQGAKFIVYAPWIEPLRDGKGQIDHNNNSIVGKFTYQKFSMLFTGDAEKKEEDILIKEQNSKLFSRVLKVGHHGSNGSSATKFIRSIRPEIGVISAGLNNEYNHPGEKTLERLAKEKVAIYRTDTQGTIRIQTDGKSWSVSTER